MTPQEFNGCMLLLFFCGCVMAHHGVVEFEKLSLVETIVNLGFGIAAIVTGAIWLVQGM